MKKADDNPSKRGESAVNFWSEIMVLGQKCLGILRVPPSCIWAYCESGPKWEISVFLFKFLEVSENQICIEIQHGLSVGELFSPPFRQLRGVVILNPSQHWPMLMIMS